MKTGWAFIALAIGLAVGLVAPRPAFLKKPQAEAVPDVKLDAVPTPVPVPEKPKLIQEPKKLLEVNLTEKEVLDALTEGSPLVKDWEWKFTPLTKVEFVSKIPAENNKAEVIVSLEDVHMGPFNQNGIKWKGLVKLQYEGVVSDKKVTIWYAKSAEILSFKKVAVVRVK